MPEFRINGDTLRREVTSRVLSWSITAGFAVAAALLFVLGIYRVLNATTLYGLVFISLVLAFIISAGVLVCREALYRAERQMIFDLNDTAITRKRPGFPEVRIAFSEIESLNEELGRLVIRSEEPARKIAVPKSVCGYERIYAELAKHHALSAHIRFPFKSTGLLVASILSWATVLWAQDEKVIILAGAVGLLTLALASRYSWTLWHHRQRRAFLVVVLLSVWLVALLLIYLRVVRP